MGKLIQVDTFTITSAASSIKLGAGSSGSSGNNVSIDSDDVYLVTMCDVKPSTGALVRARVTVSGTSDTTTNYDYIQNYLKSASAFSTNGTIDQTFWDITSTIKGTTRGASAIMYLYNFYTTSFYSAVNMEGINIHNTGNDFRALIGAGVNSQLQSCDGIELFVTSGTFDNGTFTLYKQVGT